MEDNRYYLYCRKSSEDKKKQFLSIPAQIREMTEFANRNGLVIVETFHEEKSAKVPNKRKEFNRMIENIKSGKCSQLLCWNLNRLSRNPLEGGLIHQLVTDGKIRHIRTPSEILDKDTNDIMMGVLFGSNSQYSKQLSVDTKRGIREKVMRGEWPTSAPMFYINVGTEKGSKNIEPDPSNSFQYEPWIDKIIDNELNGAQACKLLKDMGVRNKKGKPVSKSRINLILKEPVYCGILRYADCPETQGKWQPLISVKKWKLLQEVLGKKAKPHQTKREYAFNTSLRCGKCGYAISGYTKIKKSGRQYTYYRCATNKSICNNTQIKENDLEILFVEYLKQIKINQKTLTLVKHLAVNKLEQAHEYEIKNGKVIESDIAKLTKNIDTLTEMRINNELNADEYKTRKNQLLNQVSELQIKRTDIRYNREDMRNAFELFIESSIKIEETFVHGSLQTRRNIIFSICDGLVLDDGKIRLNFQKPWCDLLEVVSDPENVNWGS